MREARVPDAVQRERIHQPVHDLRSQEARSGAPLIRDRQKLRAERGRSFVRSRVCSAS